MSVTIERNGPVGTVVLERPEARNAVDGPTAQALYEAFLALDEDDGIAVCVLWGSGGTFCSGADLKAIGTERMNKVEPEGSAPMGPTRLMMSKPVIAAIEGFAVAGGLELALWCDMRVAAESASFGVFCRRWGVPLIDGGTVRLPRVVGAGHAMDMLLTGREVFAEEARTMGLVNRIVADGETRGAAEALANEIAQFPQTCMRNDRRSAIGSIGVSFDDAMRAEFELGLDTINSGETATGASRFVTGEGRHGAM
ncbi:MAG: crotonase/enoyl-CoA hydratase family protein [Acidimicrobiia bacterium]